MAALLHCLCSSHRPNKCCRFMEFFQSLADRQRAGHVDLGPGPGTAFHRSLYLIPASADLVQLFQVQLLPRDQSLPACP